MYGVYSQQAQSGGGPSVPEVIIIGGTASRIFRSTDDGESFTTQIIYHPSQPTTAILWSNVFYCNEKFIISGGYGCMVSHDYGLTWENIINAEQMFSIVWNGTYYFASIDNQIRRSADLVTWTNLTQQGTAWQRGNDLCVVGNDVYWSQNRRTSYGMLLGIRKCVAPYNSGNISLIAVSDTTVPDSTSGTLYKTSNGLILTASGSGTQQRIYSTTNYTSLTAASSSYVSSTGTVFHIVVGNTAYNFSSTSTAIRGYGSPIITTLHTNTAPQNLSPRSIDTNGTIFTASIPSGNNIFTRGVTATATAFSSTDVGFNANTVFYTGKSFLVFNNTQLRRSETGIVWSTAITPFGIYGTATINKNKIASSYKI